jgi:hypothetical protein
MKPDMFAPSALLVEKNMRNSSIILDHTFTYALLGACLRDKYIQVHLPETEDEKDDQDYYLEVCRRSALKRRILEALLFYDEVFVDNSILKLCGVADISPLEDFGCKSVPEPQPWLGYYKWEHDGFMKFVTDVFRLAIPEYKRLLYVEDDQFWELFGEEEKRDIRFFKNVIKHRSSRKTIENPYTDQIVPKEWFSILFNMVFDLAYRKRVLTQIRRDGRQWRMRTMQIKRGCFRMLEEAYNLRRLLDTSVKLRCPVLTQRLRIPPSSVETLPSHDSQLPDDLLQVYQIALNEVHYLPHVESINDVLRLHDGPRLRAFREAVHHWAKVFQEGDLSAEQRIRRDIAKASEEFCRLERWSQVGGWLTYMSIPLAIASLWLIGPVGLAASLAPTALGAAIQTYRDVKDRELRWLAFGRL